MSESAEESQRSGARSSGPEWLDRLEQVDRHVASTVKKMVRDLQDLASAAEDEAVGQLLAATARVDAETSQSGILTSLLEEGLRFASRTAFFLTRPGEVRGWAGRGFSALEQAHLDYEEGGVWARIASQSGALRLDAEECSEVCRRLGARAGSSGVLIPFILRGQLGGVLYADRLAGEGALGIASLQLLTHSAAQAVETAALRGEGGSPALRFGSAASAQRSPMSVWQAPATEAAAHDHAAAAEAAPAEVAPAAAEEPEAAPAFADSMAAAAEPAAVAATDFAPAPEPAAEEEEIEAEAVDFEMVTTDVEEDLEAEEDFEAELEPEPELELEDTGSLWAVEEDLEEDFEDDAAMPDESDFGDAPAAVSPGVGQETVRLDIAALQGQMPAAPAEPAAEEVTAKLPQWEVGAEPEPLEPEDFELEAEEEPGYEDFEADDSEPQTASMATHDFSEEATIVRPMAEVAPVEDATIVNPAPEVAPVEDATVVSTPSPMAGGYVPPAPAPYDPSEEVTPPPGSGFAVPPEPPPKPDATGTSQVVPPTDIQGPGSAFEAPQETIAEGEEALHEEARRLARLLVSEIKLYNEEIIEEGRRSGNIYERLKDDIDRSRQMYQERIDPRLLESGKDYFRQELVQRLAGGDERLLGY
jgi:hypothetical protein